MRAHNHIWGISKICMFMASFARASSNEITFRSYYEQLVEWIVDTKVKAYPPAT